MQKIQALTIYNIWINILLTFFCLYLINNSNIHVSSTTVTIPENHTLKIAIITPRINKANGAPVDWGNECLLATLLAIDAINNKTDNLYDDILPNTTIIYEYYDSLQDVETVVKIAPDFLDTAFDGEGADVVLGAGSSGSSMALQSILQYFKIPQVSGTSTSGYLSVPSDYPHFSRVIPTDGILTSVMIQFAKYELGWNSGAIISGNDPYSLYGGSALNNAAIQHDFNIKAFEIFQTGATDISFHTDNAVSLHITCIFSLPFFYFLIYIYIPSLYSIYISLSIYYYLNILLTLLINQSCY